MDCPICHSLNAEDALSCSMCGAVLFRRDESTLEHAADGPMIGLSYGTIAPDNSMLHIHARRALNFMIVTMPMHLLLIVAVLYSREIVFRLGYGESLGDNEWKFIDIGIGAFALFVLAWSIGKMGAATGTGFWINFGLTFVPPCIPGTMARIGGKSILWTYVYLALDALMISMSLQFFNYLPALALLILIVEVPLVIYHLCGCGTGSIGTSLGLNSYASTIWLCGAPLVLAIFAVIHIGLAEMLVNCMVGDGAAPTLENLRKILDPGIITNTYAVWASSIFWLGGTWVLWLKSVYESLRYPLL